VFFYLLAYETENELFILFLDNIVVVLQNCSFSLLLFFHRNKCLSLMMNQNARVGKQFCIERTDVHGLMAVVVVVAWACGSEPSLFSLLSPTPPTAATKPREK